MKKVEQTPGDAKVSAVEWPIKDRPKAAPQQKLIVPKLSEKKTVDKIVAKKVEPVLAATALTPAVVDAALTPAGPETAEPQPVVVAPVVPAPVEKIVQAVAAEPAAFAPVPVVAKPARKPVSLETAAPAAHTKGPFDMTDAMETAKTYAEDAKSRIQSAVTEMNEKAKVAMEKSAKAAEELGEITKGNLEAIVESSKIAAKGVETLSQEAVEYGRKSLERSTATFKSFAAVKSPTEFFQLQSELLSSTMDAFASETAKNSEAMLKLFGDVTQPISNRVAIVSEKFKSLAA